MMMGALLIQPMSGASAGCPILCASKGWGIANRRIGSAKLVVKGQPPANGRRAKCDAGGAPAPLGLGDHNLSRDLITQRNGCPILRVSEGWGIANHRTGVANLVVEGQPPANGRWAMCDTPPRPEKPLFHEHRSIHGTFSRSQALHLKRH